MFRDTASGSLHHRPELTNCPDYLRQGDTLVVCKLHRLGLFDTCAILSFVARVSIGSEEWRRAWRRESRLLGANGVVRHARFNLPVRSYDSTLGEVAWR